MKIDNTKHKYAWRVQKGCFVEWFEASKKGSGIVSKVISKNGPYGKEPDFVVIGKDENAVTISVDKIRIVKTKHTLEKEKYER